MTIRFQSLAPELLGRFLLDWKRLRILFHLTVSLGFWRNSSFKAWLPTNFYSNFTKVALPIQNWKDNQRNKIILWSLVNEAQVHRRSRGGIAILIGLSPFFVHSLEIAVDSWNFAYGILVNSRNLSEYSMVSSSKIVQKASFSCHLKSYLRAKVFLSHLLQASSS